LDIDMTSPWNRQAWDKARLFHSAGLNPGMGLFINNATQQNRPLPEFLQQELDKNVMQLGPSGGANFLQQLFGQQQGPPPPMTFGAWNPVPTSMMPTARPMVLPQQASGPALQFAPRKLTGMTGTPNPALNPQLTALLQGLYK